MKLATTTGDFSPYTKSQIDSLKHIRKAGFKYADYNFGTDYARRNGVYSDNFEAYCKSVVESAKEIGITLVQSHAPMGKPFLDEDGSFIEDNIRCINSCALMNIPHLVVHAGYAQDLTVEENFERNKQFFTPLLKEAEKYGINILVENFNKMYKEGVYWVDNATDLRALIDYIDHPLFHAVWDTGHANLQEMPQREELKKLGKHVYALHVHDNLGEKDKHMIPYFGTMNLDDVIHGLFDIGYNGYFTFEVGKVLLSAEKRRSFKGEDKLTTPPIEIQDALESFLYSIGKTVLEKYNCFEE